jgi:transcriptional regulator with XRE-family HTH domain
MTTQNPLHSLRNQLWLARKNTGLEQKQVAFLLGHHTTDQIHRYEKGLCLPSFTTLLQLEIIYGQPSRLLFPEHFAQLAHKITQKAGSLDLSTKLRAPSQPYCHFWDLVQKEALTEDENTAIEKHVLRFVRWQAGINEDSLPV